LKRIATLSVLIGLLAFCATANAGMIYHEEIESTFKYGTYAAANPDTQAANGYSLRYEDTGTATKTFTNLSSDITQIAVRSRNAPASTGSVTINVVVDGTALQAQTIENTTAGKTMVTRTWGVNLSEGTQHTIGVRADGVAGDDKLLIDYVDLDSNAIVVNPGVDTVPEAAPEGSTVLLRGGVYTASDDLFRFRTPGVTVKSYPGELAVLYGSVRTVESARGFVLGDPALRDGLRIDASYGVIRTGGWTDSDDVGTQGIHWDSDGGGIYGNDISNRAPNGNTDRAGMGILMSGRTNPENVTIRGNSIHATGQLPRTNHEHGIYASGMIGGEITDNLIFDNADRGIQLYSHPRNVLVSGNIVAYNHHAGVLFGSTASDNLVRNNIISHNDEFNVFQIPNTTTASGNRVEANATWIDGGTSGIRSGFSFTQRDNVVADPLYEGNFADGSVKITNPMVAAKLPVGSRFLP
jgi:parallel beta-helix repeat protein